MAGKVELASGVGEKASKATTCVQDCISKSASLNTKPSHRTIQVLNCSVMFFLPALPTCLLLEFDVFRPGKVIT